MDIRVVATCLMTGTILLLAGCAGDPSPPVPPETAKVMGGTAGAPAPLLKGQGEFFDGALLVEATLAPRRMAFGRQDANARGRGGPHRGRRSHGEGGMPDAGGKDEDRPHVLQESRMPAIALQLHLTNQGTTPLTVTFTQCDSELGNFVVMPETVTLQPKETVDTEHMTSRLGFAGGELPLTLGLRSASQKEKQVVTLRTAGAATVPSATARP
jgi:hypothetical protein